MLQIPVTGLYAVFSAIHQPAGALLLFALQQVVDVNPYVQVYFQ